MVDVESFENNVSIYGFEIESNYDQLFDAFSELHGSQKIIIFPNNKLKGGNMQLKYWLKQLNEMKN